MDFKLLFNFINSHKPTDDSKRFNEIVKEHFSKEKEVKNA